MKKIITPTILFIAVLVFSFFAISREKSRKQSPAGKIKTEENKEENQIILFYGDGCPHCEIVEEYIEENNIRDKVSFSRKEIYYNKENSKKIEEKAKICGVPANSIGVPFLWDGEKCLIGDQDIIDFFSAKSGYSALEGRQKTNE